MAIGRNTLLLVDRSELKPLVGKDSLPVYFRQLWDRRYFIRAEAASKAFSSGRDMFLGKAWIVLDPLLQVTVYGLVFGLILKTSRGMDNFVGFLVLGVVFFGFMSRGINAASGLIQRSRNLIVAFSFPRAALIFSLVLRQAVDNLFPALVAVIVAVLFQSGANLSFNIVFIVPVYLLMHLFVLAGSFWVSRFTAFIPDLKSVVSLVLRGVFYFSGVFYSVDRFETEPTLEDLVYFNPFYRYLAAIRELVLDGTLPSLAEWGYLSLWTALPLVAGFLFFWRAEERYAHVK